MTYVRLDKIKKNAHIESIVSATDLKNGAFLALGELQEDGETRLVTASKDETKQLVFHASVPLQYESGAHVTDFVLKAGKVGRAFVLEKGNIVSISKAAVTGGTVAKGALVNPSETGFDVIDGVEVANKAVTGEIIALEVDAIAGELAVIRIS